MALRRRLRSLFRQLTAETPQPSDDPTGKVGVVTGPIVPGHLGEVSLSIRGVGTSRFLARATQEDATIPVGSRVLVVDFDPPQTVYVDTFTGVT